MAIKRVEFEDFLVFGGKFGADFCPGLNVLIGGNATGKSTLLRALYGFCFGFSEGAMDIGNIASAIDEAAGHVNPDELFPEVSAWIKEAEGNIRKSREDSAEESPEYDCDEIEELEGRLEGLEEEIRIWESCISDLFLDLFFKPGESGGRIYAGAHWNDFSDEPESGPYLAFTAESRHMGKCGARVFCDSYRDLAGRPTFIPVMDALSFSQITRLNDSYKKSLDLDPIVPEIIKQAGWLAPDAVPEKARGALGELAGEIGGEVLAKEDGTFWVRKRSGKEIPYRMEAEGHKKLGLLWRLLRNDSIGSVLFWDEPESSINPEFASALADILLGLSRGGAQVFVATQSELLAGYFDANRAPGDEVLFTSLYREGGAIKASSDTRFDWVSPNSLTDEPVRLYEKKLDRALGDV